MVSSNHYVLIQTPVWFFSTNNGFQTKPRTGVKKRFLILNPFRQALESSAYVTKRMVAFMNIRFVIYKVVALYWFGFAYLVALFCFSLWLQILVAERFHWLHLSVSHLSLPPLSSPAAVASFRFYMVLFDNGFA